MVVVWIDGEEYGIFSYAKSLQVEAELIRQYPGSSVRVWELD
jgi:hypothetical protein